MSLLFAVTAPYVWTVGQTGLSPTDQHLCELAHAWLGSLLPPNCSVSRWFPYIWAIGGILGAGFLMFEFIPFWVKRVLRPLYVVILACGVFIGVLIARSEFIWQPPTTEPKATSVQTLEAISGSPSLSISPTIPTLTAESLATRQKALTQLSDFIDQYIVALSLSGSELIDATNRDRPATLLSKAKEVLTLSERSYDEQTKILIRYNGIDDIFRIADWNYLEKDIKPTTNEYVSTIELLTNNSVTVNDGSLSRHKSFERFAHATEKLSDWINEARRNIGNKRTEYDKTQVYK